MKMKQKMKRLLACTLAFAMLMTLSVVTKAQAAVKDNFPNKARIYTYENGLATGQVEITLADQEKSVSNVKSKDKNLIVKLTEQEKNIYYENLDNNSYTIGFGTEKSGTYTVTYDIVKNGKTVDTKKITVYAYPHPIKTLSIDGKRGNFYGSAKKGKVKVELQPGNTIKKLEVGTYKRVSKDEYGTKKVSSEMKYKTFKNGSSVTFGTSGYYYESKYDDRGNYEGNTSYHGNMNSSLFSSTSIRVTYKDKYTKETETINYVLRGYAK